MPRNINVINGDVLQIIQCLCSFYRLNNCPVHCTVVLCSSRFCLGAGVGGEYPLAATVTSESSSAARRGALMAGNVVLRITNSLIQLHCNHYW